MKRISVIACALALFTAFAAGQQTGIRVNGVEKMRLKPDSIKSYVPHYFDGGIMSPTVWHPVLSGDARVDSSQIRIHTPDKARYHTVATVNTAFSPVWSLPTMNGGTFSFHDNGTSFSSGSVGYYNSSGRIVELLAGTNGYVLKMVGGLPAWAVEAGGGITTLNTLTADPQTFAVGTAGTDFAINSATATHTFNLPTASGSNRGALSSADWTTFNNKVATTRTLTMTGTTNQVSVTNSGVAQDLSANRSWTFSLPQNIHTGAAVTFLSAVFTAGTGSITAPEIRGGTTPATALVLTSTSDASKGDIYFGPAGASKYEETGGNMILSGLTASRALATDTSKRLVSATTTATELGYVNGVTSAIQTQINTKAPTASPTFTGTVTIPSPFTLGATSVTATGTELNYVGGVTSGIQTQLNGKLSTSSSSTQDGYFGDLHLFDDATPSHYLKLTAGDNLTAARTLTILTGDASRQLTVAGTASVNGTNTGDVTKSGESYISLSGQAITANQINLATSDVIGALTVNKGGTGRTTLTSNYILTGNATSTVNMVDPGSAGNVFMNVGGAIAAVARRDTIVKAFGFYGVSATDSAYILEVPSGAADYTVIGVRAIRTGGTSATIYVRNVTDAAAVCTDYAVGTTFGSATLSATALSSLDAVRVAIKAISGTVQELMVQIIYSRPL